MCDFTELKLTHLYYGIHNDLAFECNICIPKSSNIHDQHHPHYHHQIISNISQQVTAAVWNIPFSWVEWWDQHHQWASLASGLKSLTYVDKTWTTFSITSFMEHHEEAIIVVEHPKCYSSVVSNISIGTLILDNAII